LKGRSVRARLIASPVRVTTATHLYGRPLLLDGERYGGLLAWRTHQHVVGAARTFMLTN
jgi:hypothetical protein